MPFFSFEVFAIVCCVSIAKCILAYKVAVKSQNSHIHSSVTISNESSVGCLRSHSYLLLHAWLRLASLLSVCAPEVACRIRFATCPQPRRNIAWLSWIHFYFFKIKNILKHRHKKQSHFQYKNSYKQARVI